MTSSQRTFAAVITLACLPLLACHITPVTGVKQYHSAYQGIDFVYPAAWHEKQEEHAAAKFEGANECGIYISGMQSVAPETVAQSLKESRDFQRELDGTSTFADRPAWSGSQKPDGSYQITTTDKRGRHNVEYNTAFMQEDRPLIVAERLREGDAECIKQLQVFESKLHIYKPDRTQ